MAGSGILCRSHLNRKPTAIEIAPQSKDKVREVIKLIEDDGWYLVRTPGSHRQFKHPTKKGVVTVAGKPADDVRKGTLNSILKQAGLNLP